MGFPAHRCAAALLLALCLPPVHAAGGAEQRLHEFFQGLRSLEAGFEQSIAQDGRVIQRTRGRLHILRPGKFRWAYESPFEQLIITDGETLWVYEPDLDQVTRSALDDSVGNTPAILLSTEQPLAELFLIVDAGPKDGLLWAMLEPRGEQAAFSRIFLGFDARTLAAMEIVDALEQTVQIRFTDLRRNVNLDPALFEFTVPEGVDVVGED